MRRNLNKITHNKDLHVGVNKISFFHRRHDTVSRRQSLHGFTLVELLVVISIIALLLSILMPSLNAARSQAKAVICKSNSRQLALANLGYTVENNGSYVSAASDMPVDNLHRWHGVRETTNDEFDPLKGPLVSYFGDGQVKECSERAELVKSKNFSSSFEKGGGGYGYNMTYIGSRLWKGGVSSMAGMLAAYANSSKVQEVKRPAETIMFADSAMANKEAGVDYIHEYSFAVPPFFVYKGEPEPSWGFASPSIHFRHRETANIGWVDGHVSAEERIRFERKNAYGVKSADFDIGWFGELSNKFFDLE